ncbi:metallophosphoesterase [Yoonia sp. SS1-5]|uniref:Metallophosphoesterase n=1 Tax=Yoonia rhodophyticola TaxID=3137370 RepID=A0AAN0MM01_9RHOB
MSLLYAIGDIHGQMAMLEHALALIAADGGDDAKVVFLGDYTDRGPDSQAVIDTLIKGREAGRDWVFIKGNHDRLFSNFVRHGIEHDPRVKSGISWLNPRLGGTATLASYGVTGQMHFERPSQDALETLAYYTGDSGRITKDALQRIAQQHVPQSHLDFLDELPLTYQTDDLIFVHAGLRPGIPLEKQDPEDLIWIRDGFLESTHDFGKLVVHGHTALDHPTHFGNRIDLDGGAGYGKPLVPAVFEGRDCWLLTDKGRVALTP